MKERLEENTDIHQAVAIVDHNIKSEKDATIKIKWAAGDVTKEPLTVIDSGNSSLLAAYVKRPRFTRKNNPVPLPYMIVEHLRSVSGGHS